MGYFGQCRFLGGFYGVKQALQTQRIITKTLQGHILNIKMSSRAGKKFKRDDDRYNNIDYNIQCQTLAKQLMGQTLVRVIRDDNGTLIRRFSGRIVETESYLGGEDKASHSFQGKKTAANEPMFMKPGTAYVYMTYGMYHCFNISSAEEGSAVLIRALEPLEELDEMRKNRGVKRADAGATLKDKDLCNGPSKLCQALKIDKSLNKVDMTTSDLLWIENCKSPQKLVENIISAPRIGITARAGVWMMKPLRFYVKENINVSKRDKTVERNLDELQNELVCK